MLMDGAMSCLESIPAFDDLARFEWFPAPRRRRVGCRGEARPKSGLCSAPRLSYSPRLSVTLEVPNEVTQAMRLPAPEAKARLRLELAIGLYTQRLLPLGKAALLAELSRWEVEDILGRRGVPAHYTEEDLVHDAAYADRHP
jgi:predicted HTH domain antitoxin